MDTIVADISIFMDAPFKAVVSPHERTCVLRIVERGVASVPRLKLFFPPDKQEQVQAIANLLNELCPSPVQPKE